MSRVGQWVISRHQRFEEYLVETVFIQTWKTCCIVGQHHGCTALRFAFYLCMVAHSVERCDACVRVTDEVLRHAGSGRVVRTFRVRCGECTIIRYSVRL